MAIGLTANESAADCRSDVARFLLGNRTQGNGLPLRWGPYLRTADRLLPPSAVPLIVLMFLGYLVGLGFGDTLRSMTVFHLTDY